MGTYGWSMVKAYIDDSMADGRVLVFGGLIASTERWKAFEISWQQCLDHANRKVFKTKNVVRAGRVRKREHAKRHYQTVREHAQGGICFVVPIACPFHLFHRASQRRLGSPARTSF